MAGGTDWVSHLAPPTLAKQDIRVCFEEELVEAEVKAFFDCDS